MGWLNSLFGEKKQFSDKAEMVIILTVGKEEYPVEQVDIRFKRDVDRFNIPVDATYGGLITCTFSGMPGDDLLRWAVYGNEHRDGEIRFYQQKNWGQQGAILVLRFIDAHCANLRREVDNRTSQQKIEITITPHLLKIGMDEFENKWRS